jgi:hypothetical protein
MSDRARQENRMSVATPETDIAEPVTPEAASTLEAVDRKLIEAQPYTGHLAIQPGQKALNAEQEAAFSAIVNFSLTDEEFHDEYASVMANINVFLHVCQRRGLDPWARQIYLVRRGGKGKRTYSIQTGIDGYRYLAEKTSRAIGTAKIFWSGQDDDERSWREVTDQDLGITYQDRRWWGAWPKSRGNPGMARAVLPYRLLNGEIVRADVIAHWGMFAPYFEKWEGYGNNRKPAKDPATGRTIMILADMWDRDGGAHQLGKCAEAFAIRKAFPDAVAGIFVNEEMHQADAQARRDAEDERRRRILEAREAEQAKERESVTLHSPGTPARTVPGTVEQEEAGPEAPVAAQPSALERRAWLLEELEEMTRIRGGSSEQILQYMSSRLGTDVRQADPEDLLAMVGPLRQLAVKALRDKAVAADDKAAEAEAAEDHTASATLRADAERFRQEADAYEQAGSVVVAPVDELLGRVVPGDDTEGEPEAAGDGVPAPEGAAEGEDAPQPGTGG